MGFRVTLLKPESKKWTPRTSRRAEASHVAPLESGLPQGPDADPRPAFSFSLDRMSIFASDTLGEQEGGVAVDPLDAEANRAAGQVMRMPASSWQRPTREKRGSGCDSAPPASEAAHNGYLESPPGQNELPSISNFHSGASLTAVPVPTSVRSVLSQAGRQMDAVTRGFMESRFSHDFSNVRIHADAASAESAAEIRARAYTVANNVVFAAGQFAPTTTEGKTLLAHELTHVLQQGGGPFAIQRSPATDQRFSEDMKVARYRGRLIAQRIRTHGMLSKEAEAKIQRELAYFKGAARDAYRREVQPALDALKPMKMPKPIELVPRFDDPQYCGGSKCVSDDELYAGQKKSEDKNRARDTEVVRQRRTNVIGREATLRALNAEVERTQRGTRQHRYAQNRLDTFKETGVDPGPHMNYDGGPGAENIALGVAGGILLAGAAAGAAAAPVAGLAEAGGTGLATTATTAAPVVALAATPQGQQLIEESGEALENLAPAIEADVPDVIAQQAETVAPDVEAAVPEVQTAASALDSSQSALNVAKETAASVADKLNRYLLNPDHPVGGSKADWFRRALGFTRDNAAQLANQIVFKANEAVQTAVTQFGTKYNQIIQIVGANGKTIPVTVAWIIGPDGVPKLVTAIPTKGG